MSEDSKIPFAHAGLIYFIPEQDIRDSFLAFAREAGKRHGGLITENVNMDVGLKTEVGGLYQLFQNATDRGAYLAEVESRVRELNTEGFVLPYFGDTHAMTRFQRLLMNTKVAGSLMALGR